MSLPLNTLRDEHPAAALVIHQLVPLVDRFRELQLPSGAVSGAHEQALGLLDRIVPLVTATATAAGVPGLGEAFAADTREWCARGLDQVPTYDRTLDVYRPPKGDGVTFFCAPLLATNGPAPRGHFLECFLAYREEPEVVTRLERDYPHPKNKCQSARLVYGSRGMREGNCIVFFPENIASARKVQSQDYALFFFNKFNDIYLSFTRPAVERLFGTKDLLTSEEGWRSFSLSPEAFYQARCVWGYLHDYHHHRGPRPFDENLQVKLNWFVGLLEETKVDCQTMLTCLHPEVPYGIEVLEFALFERLLRYPQQPDCTTNFDAGTGVLLFEWLLSQGAIRPRPGQAGLELERAALVGALEALIERVEALERISDDARYKAEAKAFVRTFVPEGEAAGHRFRVPDAYRAHVGLQPSPRVLSFETLAY
jgi:hypothetical protein